MRGGDTLTESPFALHYMEDFVPGNHPLRPMVNKELENYDKLFAGMYEAYNRSRHPVMFRPHRSSFLPRTSKPQVGLQNIAISNVTDAYR